MGKLRWAILLLTAVLAVLSTNDVSAQTCDIAVDGTCSPGLTPDPSDNPSSEPADPGSSGADEKPPDESTGSLRDRMFVLVNSERAKENLPLLVVQPWAESISTEHSIRMRNAGSIWHNDDYFARGRKSMGSNFLGENVGMGVSIEGAHRSLMDSPPHRKNILDSRFSHLGIGVARNDEDGMLYVTEAFARIPPATSDQTKTAGSTSATQSAAPNDSSLPAATVGAVTVVAWVDSTTPSSVRDETSSAEPVDAIFLSSDSTDSGLKKFALGLWLFVAVSMLTRRFRLNLREMASLRTRAGVLLQALSNDTESLETKRAPAASSSMAY